MSDNHAVHLGDGAYVSDDGYGLAFTANHHDPEQATDTVYLDPGAVEQLEKFIVEFKERRT